ncbi:MAG: alpha-L-arabinofuranosidase C-terminal domain-containing protein [Candidatus Bathyarchaeia archaeon]
MSGILKSTSMGFNKNAPLLFFVIAILIIIMLSIISNIHPFIREERILEGNVVIFAGNEIGEINPNIYGIFIEHMGRCIYGGVWVGEESRIPNLMGYRLDVLEAAREIRPPVVRWPGGNFASGYNWTDGVGPRNKRPIRSNPAWGGIETNEFGTDEFIGWCRLVGAEPYIVVNVGSGTPELAAAWVEYCNGDANTTYGRLRAENGHPEPYNVKYWGIGNEMYGWWQIGHMNATEYSKAVIEFAEAMKSVDPSIKLIAVGWYGAYGEPELWNRKVLQVAGKYIDYLSLHVYYGYEDYYTIVACPLETERTLNATIRMMESLMINLLRDGKRIEIAMDEWGVWYPEANAQNNYVQTLRLCDGIFAAGMFHVFHRLSNYVTMANFAQFVNTLPMIVTNDRGDMYVNPVYLAFKLYRNRTGKIVLKTIVDVDGYRVDSIGITNVPYLDVSATMDEDESRLYIAVINRHMTDKIKATISIRDFEPKRLCEISQLNGPKWDSKNDFSSPNTVKIISQNVNLEIANNSFTYIFEPHSVTILVLEGSRV